MYTNKATSQQIAFMKYHQLVWLSCCPLLDGYARRRFESSYPMSVGFGLWFLKKNEMYGWSPSQGHYYVLVGGVQVKSRALLCAGGWSPSQGHYYVLMALLCANGTHRRCICEVWSAVISHMSNPFLPGLILKKKKKKKKLS